MVYPFYPIYSQYSNLFHSCQYSGEILRLAMTYHKLLVTNLSSLFPWEPRNYPWIARRDNCTHRVCFQQPFGNVWTFQIPGPNEK